jgi:hypothetical protein
MGPVGRFPAGPQFARRDARLPISAKPMTPKFMATKFMTPKFMAVTGGEVRDSPKSCNVFHKKLLTD